MAQQPVRGEGAARGWREETRKQGDRAEGGRASPSAWRPARPACALSCGTAAAGRATRVSRPGYPRGSLWWHVRHPEVPGPCLKMTRTQLAVGMADEHGAGQATGVGSLWPWLSGRGLHKAACRDVLWGPGVRALSSGVPTVEHRPGAGPSAPSCDVPRRGRGGRPGGSSEAAVSGTRPLPAPARPPQVLRLQRKLAEAEAGGEARETELERRLQQGRAVEQTLRAELRDATRKLRQAGGEAGGLQARLDAACRQVRSLEQELARAERARRDAEGQLGRLWTAICRGLGLPGRSASASPEQPGSPARGQCAVPAPPPARGSPTPPWPRTPRGGAWTLCPPSSPWVGTAERQGDGAPHPRHVPRPSTSCRLGQLPGWL